MPLPFLASAGGAAIISGGAGLLGNIVSGIFGSKSSKHHLQGVRETNAANIQMNRENNDLQRELANQKYEKDLEQWNRQNLYNSPSAQRLRMLEAGLNPALGEISTGTAQSSPEMAMAQTTPGHAEQEPYIPPQDYGLSNLGTLASSALNSYHSTLMMQEQVKAQQIANKHAEAETLARINKLKSEIKNNELKAVYQGVENQFAGNMFQSSLDLNEASRSMSQTMREGQVLINAYKAKEIKVFDEVHQRNVAESIARVAEMYSRRELNRGQLSKVLSEDRQVQEAIKSLQMDNKHKEAVFDNLIEFTVSQAEEQTYKAERAKWEKNPHFDEVKRHDMRYGNWFDRTSASFLNGLFGVGGYLKGWLGR